YLLLTKSSNSRDVIVPLIVFSTIVGCGFALGTPAMQAMVPRLVKVSELSRASTLDTMPMILGRAIGPVLGGVLAVGISYDIAFFAASAGHAIFALVLWRIAPRRIKLQEGGNRVVISGSRWLKRNIH